MAHNINNFAAHDLGGLPIDALLPERPAIIGEFSPAYEAFKTATLSDLEPMNNYELVLALQLVDLNWAILQRKASADIELSVGTENKIRSELKSKLIGKVRGNILDFLGSSRVRVVTRMTLKTRLTGTP